MTRQEIIRPTGKSVWTGKELSKSTEWIYRFTPKGLADVDRCLIEARRRGATVETIGRKDFQLEAIAGDLAEIKQELAAGRGFVVMRGLPREKYTDEDLSLIFWGIGTHFGVGMAQSYLGDRLGHVMDLTDEEPDLRRRRAYHSGGPLRLHSDSCDILAMISLRGARAGGESRLASAHTVHNLLFDQCEPLLRVLYDGFYLRRTDSDAEAMGLPALTEHRVPAFRLTEGWLNCWFVRGRVTRAIELGDIELSPPELAALEAFEAVANHPDIYLDMDLRPGDMQWINNRVIIHGRSDFDDFPEKERRRHLLRLWLTVRDWPAMDPLQTIHPDHGKLRWAKSAGSRAG